MSLGPDRRLRVEGDIYFSPDARGRRRPLVNNDFALHGMTFGAGGLIRMPFITAGFRVRSDERGHFATSVIWEQPGRGQVPPLDEPDGFEVMVVDPDTGQMEPAGEVVSNGDGMVIDSGLVPDDEPLARRTGGREFDEIPDLATHLAEALAQPEKLGELTVLRPFFEPRDRQHPTGPERLYRHFSILLDRLQAALRTARGPQTSELYVPTGFKPLEDRVLATLAWYPKGLPAAERCRRLVAGYAGEEPSEELLRRVVPRLTSLLGRILQMPVATDNGTYLWEDLAVLLTLTAGIGFVAQHNHIVWADYIDQPEGRRLILSTV